MENVKRMSLKKQKYYLKDQIKKRCALCILLYRKKREIRWRSSYVMKDARNVIREKKKKIKESL